MKRDNLRARLEAAAAGKSSTRRAQLLQPADVAAHQPAFDAWARFVRTSGEPLNAPAELVGPLP